MYNQQLPGLGGFIMHKFDGFLTSQVWYWPQTSWCVEFWAARKTAIYYQYIAHLSAAQHTTHKLTGFRSIGFNSLWNQVCGGMHVKLNFGRNCHFSSVVVCSVFAGLLITIPHVTSFMTLKVPAKSNKYPTVFKPSWEGVNYLVLCSNNDLILTSILLGWIFLLQNNSSKMISSI